MTRLRIASWNLKAARGSEAQELGALLAAKGGADIALLQEVSTEGFPKFRSAAGLDWGVHIRDQSIDLLRVMGRAKGKDPFPRKAENGRCVAIAGREGEAPPVSAFPEMPVVEKVMAAWINLDGVRTTLVSFHSPSAAGYGGPTKAAQASRLAHWIARIEGPVILAGDFNTPAVDPPDWESVEVGWRTGKRRLGGADGEDQLVGVRKIHGLTDSLRTHLENHPDRMEMIKAKRPNGPLKVSHRTTGGAPYRYDSIWLSDHFEVHNVEYVYKEALAAGTDHALVLADIELKVGRRP